MRWFRLTLVFVSSLTAALASEEQPPPASPEAVEHLPAFKVTEPRAGDFLLHYGPIERNVGGPPREVRYLGPTRMWLTQWPRPKGVRGGASLPPNTAMYVGAAYRGRGLKDGDEIMSISGKLLTEMKPGECEKFFRDAVHYSEKKNAEIEVRAKGEKGVRQITLTKAPFNEVVVTKQPIVVPPAELPATK